MGIAKSKDTVSETHGSGRIRSLFARTAGAINSAIERLGMFFALVASCVAWRRRRGKAEIAPWRPIAALAIAVAVSTAAQIWWVSYPG